MIIFETCLSPILTDFAELCSDVYDRICALTKVLQGDTDQNVIVLLMNNNRTELAGALQWIYDRHEELVSSFMGDILHYTNGAPSWDEDTNL